MFNTSPDAGLEPGNTNVTVQVDLLAIYYHLRTAVKSAEYKALSKSRKAEIFLEFERRVGHRLIVAGKGPRLVDFLNVRFRAQGLVRDHSEDSDGKSSTTWCYIAIASHPVISIIRRE